MPLHDWECENGHQFERYIKKPDYRPKCPECGGSGTKVWLPTGRVGGEAGSEYPKTTSDIDGVERTFADAAQERQFLKEHNERTGENVRLRDDAAFVEKRHEGLDWKTGSPVYSEPSGLGIPGSWGGLGSGDPYWEKLGRYDDEEE